MSPGQGDEIRNARPLVHQGEDTTQSRANGARTRWCMPPHKLRPKRYREQSGVSCLSPNIVGTNIHTPFFFRCADQICHKIKKRIQKMICPLIKGPRCVMLTPNRSIKHPPICASRPPPNRGTPGPKHLKDKKETTTRPHPGSKKLPSFFVVFMTDFKAVLAFFPGL